MMSHIHIPDGVAQDIWWLLMLGYMATFLVLFLVLRQVDREEAGRKISLVGTISAMMLITMSVPLGFIPFHLNLASLCGIIIGPKLGFLAVFVVNLILAFIGHGGITVVGLNTLIIGLEVFCGHRLYNILSKQFRSNTSSGLATFFSLILSTATTFYVLSLILGGEKVLPHVYHGVDASTPLRYGGWLTILIMIAIGIALESIASSLIVSFLSKVKPDLVKPIQKHG